MKNKFSDGSIVLSLVFWCNHKKFQNISNIINDGIYKVKNCICSRFLFIISSNIRIQHLDQYLEFWYNKSGISIISISSKNKSSLKACKELHIKSSYHNSERINKFCSINLFVPITQLGQHIRHILSDIISNFCIFNLYLSNILYLKICLTRFQLFCFLSCIQVFHNLYILMVFFNDHL
jgi:hypothetical protein